MPPHLLRRAAAGFESVHLSLGSLSTARADVVPVDRMNPAAAWSPRPLVSRLRRFGPLMSATIALIAAEVSPRFVDSVRASIVVGLLVLAFGYLWSSPRRETYWRARQERSATIVMRLAAFIWTGSVYTPAGTPATNRTLLLLPLLAIGGPVRRTHRCSKPLARRPPDPNPTQVAPPKPAARPPRCRAARTRGAAAEDPLCRPRQGHRPTLAPTSPGRVYQYRYQ